MPSLSFTGGESTLRPDLPELVRFGERLGFRVNLITNGIRAADAAYAATPGRGRPGLGPGLARGRRRRPPRPASSAGPAPSRSTVAGHPQPPARSASTSTPTPRSARPTSTTPPSWSASSRARAGAADDVDEHGDPHRHGRRRRTEWASRYAEVAERLPRAARGGAERGRAPRLVLADPLLPLQPGAARPGRQVLRLRRRHPLGRPRRARSCPARPSSAGSARCSSARSTRSARARAARYWRERRFAPPACRDCPDVDVCGGACPLYWDAAGSFAELPRPGAADARSARAGRRSAARAAASASSAPAREEARHGHAEGLRELPRRGGAASWSASRRRSARSRRSTRPSSPR